MNNLEIDVPLEEHVPPLNSEGKPEPVVEPCPIEEHIETRYNLAMQ